MIQKCEDLNIEINKQINRIKGQVGGVEKMISEGREPIDIVTQISAIRAGLSRLALDILKSESSECFQIKNEEDKLKKFEELVSQFFKIS